MPEWMMLRIVLASKMQHKPRNSDSNNECSNLDLNGAPDAMTKAATASLELEDGHVTTRCGGYTQVGADHGLLPGYKCRYLKYGRLAHQVAMHKAQLQKRDLMQVL